MPRRRSSEEEFATLKGAMQTLEFLTRELEKKSVSIQRLKQLLFGASTETTAKVIEKILERAGKTPAAETAAAGGAEPAAEKPRGHGRNGADAYGGARRVRVPLAIAARRRRLPELREGHSLRQLPAGPDRAAHGPGPDRRGGVRTGEVALQPVRGGVHGRGAGRAWARRSTMPNRRR